VAQIADGALQEITNLLTRSVTLAEQAATDTVDSTGRASLNAEFTQIESEIARIAETTNFNGTSIFGTDGVNGQLKVFVGDINGNSSIAVSIATITADATAGTVSNLGASGPGLTGVDLTGASAAKGSIDDIKAALNAVSNMRANIGAGMNRLSSAVSVLQTQSQNTSAAESTIRDANFAEEVANMTKFQILSQSGMAALAQANSSSQSVLSLLR
jgi:flagellin